METVSGPTALDVVVHARRFEPRFVLVDIHIGGGVGSGIELIGPLVSKGAQVVMLTAESRRMVLAECVEAGAAGWIGKGVAFDEVDSTLGHVLDGGRQSGGPIELRCSTSCGSSVRARSPPAPPSKG